VSSQSLAAPCRILGLDPGSRHTGFGIIDFVAGRYLCVAHGSIDVGALSLPDRMRRIHSGVRELLTQYAPDEIAIERVFVNRNIDSALKLGQARGAALSALDGYASVAEYAPRAVKLATVGSGAADKAQVAHMVRALLQLDAAVRGDAADALAVALCHAQSRRLGALLAVPA
jgi:crossover junction endodeoxyribonuclease RuvC